MTHTVGTPQLRRIVLIGLPGSGKSTAGRHVARHFAWPFVDADEAIETALGMTIKEYFAANGESAFRDCEAETLRKLLERPGPFVLSTGGGAVLRPENRQLLKAAGTVLYLQASPETIYRRLRHDTQRPLLQVSDPMEKIRALFNERDALYRETAHHVVHSGRSPLPVLVQKIIKRLQPGNSLSDRS